jgi:ribose transport system substrate-binding protein
MKQMALTRVRRRSAALAAAALGATVIAACGSSSSGGSGSSGSGSATTSGAAASGSATTSASSGGGSSASSGVAEAKKVVAKYSQTPTKISQTTPLSKKPPSNEKFIYLVQGSVPAVVAIGVSACQAAKTLGWQCSTINYDPSSPSSIQQAFTSALSEHATMVGITGFAPYQFGNSVIKAYDKAKIPIFVGAGGPVPTNNPYIYGTAAAPVNTEVAGERVADWFIADSGGKGSAVIVNIPSFTTLAAGQKGIQNEVKRLCSGCSTAPLAVTLQQVGAGSVPNAVISYLQAHQSTKYVLFTDGDWAAGITQALDGAGLNDIKVGGMTPTPEQFSELKSGKQSAWAGYNFQYNGYGLIDLAARWAVGDPRTSADDVMPTQILTKANVGNATAFTAPTDSLAQFEKLWKVK